jgi:valyl-tRNA synthetase
LGRLTLTDDGPAPAASIPVPGGAIEVLPTPDVDLAAAEAKRATERDRLRAEIARSEAKLQTPGFVAKAPPHVVNAERDKLETLRAELAAI